jgi:serine/threonine-protein kinase RsbT
MRTVSHEELEIACEDDVVRVRRAVRKLAEERGFDPFATAAITTAASELARNVFLYAKPGRAVIEQIDKAGRVGIRLELHDRGPGIADVDRVLSGGYSSRRSLGLGISGSRRLVDEFEIETALGKGTVIRTIKWARFSSRNG